MAYGPHTNPRTQTSRSGPYGWGTDLPGDWECDYFESSSGSTHSEGRVLCARTFKIENGSIVPRFIYPNAFRPITSMNDIRQLLMSDDDIRNVNVADVYKCLYGILGCYMQDIADKMPASESKQGTWLTKIKVRDYFIRLFAYVEFDTLTKTILSISKTPALDSESFVTDEVVHLNARQGIDVSDDNTLLSDADSWWEALKMADHLVESRVPRIILRHLTTPAKLPTFEITITLSNNAAVDIPRFASNWIMLNGVPTLRWLPTHFLTITYN